MLFHLHTLIHIPFIFVLSNIHIAVSQVVKKNLWYFTSPLSGIVRPFNRLHHHNLLYLNSRKMNALLTAVASLRIVREEKSFL